MSLADISKQAKEQAKTAIREGKPQQYVERQANKIPDATFVALAVGSMAVSAGLAMFARKKEWANFIGLWAPSFLLFGVYNKLNKLEQELH